MQNIVKLFVYGSLRSGFKHPAYEYISKYFNLVGQGKVKGKMYDMGNYPAAVPATSEDYIVGELYELKEANSFTWAFEQLDDYEGVNPDDNDPALYTRTITTVYIDNHTYEAWIYWYNAPIADKPLIVSGDILEFIQHKSKL